MLGRKIRDVLVLPDDVAEADSIMAAVVGGKPWSGEFPIRTRDGSAVTFA